MDRSVYIVIRRTGEDGSPAVSDPLLSNEAAAKHARRVSTLGVLFKNIRLFIYLAVSGLSWDTRDLSLQSVDSLVSARGLSCSGVWDVSPPPGTEPKSPASQDGFLTSGRSEKSRVSTLDLMAVVFQVYVEFLSSEVKCTSLI